MILQTILANYLMISFFKNIDMLLTIKKKKKLRW